MGADCLFCRIVRKEIPARLVHEDERVVAFEDVKPQAPTHLLVIPRRHIATNLELGTDDRELIGELVLTANRLAAGRGLARSGFRLVMNCLEGAGQSVFHLHLHVLGGRRMAWPPG